MFNYRDIVGSLMSAALAGTTTAFMLAGGAYMMNNKPFALYSLSDKPGFHSFLD